MCCCFEKALGKPFNFFLYFICSRFEYEALVLYKRFYFEKLNDSNYKSETLKRSPKEARKCNTIQLKLLWLLSFKTNDWICFVFWLTSRTEPKSVRMSAVEVKFIEVL